MAFRKSPLFVGIVLKARRDPAEGVAPESSKIHAEFVNSLVRHAAEPHLILVATTRSTETTGESMIDFVKTVTQEGIAIVRVEGWLETFSCPYFFGCMEDLIRDGHREIVIDCEEIGLISSSCLSSLMQARQRTQKQGGKIVLANVNASVLEAIGFLGLKQFFGVYPSVDQALIKIRRKLRRQDHQRLLATTIG